MESLVILVVAASLSAAVVWWAMASSETRTQPKPPGKVSVPDTPTVAEDEARPEGFVLMPTDGPVSVDDRPPPALSLIRLVLTIAFVAAIGVVILAVLGWLVKLQLDRYFSQLGS